MTFFLIWTKLWSLYFVLNSGIDQADIIVAVSQHLAFSLCERSLTVTYDLLCNIAKIRCTLTQNDVERAGLSSL